MVTAFTLEHIQMEVIRLRTILLTSACCDTDKRWSTPLFRCVYLPPNISSVIESQDEREYLLIFLFSRATPYWIPSGYLCNPFTWCNYPERSVYIIVHQNAPTVASPLLSLHISFTAPALKCVSVIHYISWRGRCSHIYYINQFMKRQTWNSRREGNLHMWQSNVRACERSWACKRARES